MNRRFLSAALALGLSLGLSLGLWVPAQAAAEVPDLSAWPDLQVTWMPGYELPPYYGVSSAGLVMAVDKATGLMGVLDASGRVVVPCTYQNLMGYRRRRDFVEILDGDVQGSMRLFDAEGALREVPYDFIPDFFSGLSPVTDPQTGLTGFLNEDYELAIPCLYSGGQGYFQEDGGGYLVQYRDGVGGLLDTRGNFTVPEGWDSVEDRTGDSALLVVARGEERALIERETGRVVIPPGTYDRIVPQAGDGGPYLLVYVRDDGQPGGERAGAVDLSGKEVVPVQYSDVRLWEADYIYSGTCFLVRGEQGWGLLDAAGEELLPCAYDLDMTAHMGPSGPSIYDVLHQLHPEVPEYAYTPTAAGQDGLSAYSEAGEDGTVKWGFRDETSNAVTPALFDSVGECTFRGWCTVSLDGVYGLLKDPRNRDKVSDWAQAEVAEARARGLVTERTGTYMTYQITRLQFAELAVALAEQATGAPIEPAPADRFADTSDLMARKAAAAGIVSGTGDGSRFSPDAFITREEIAAMLYRTLVLTGRDLPAPEAGLAGARDAELVSEWAREAVAALRAGGILKGTAETLLEPQAVTTVEQAVLLVLRAAPEEA